jgi:hypothetical protein
MCAQNACEYLLTLASIEPVLPDEDVAMPLDEEEDPLIAPLDEEDDEPPGFALSLLLHAVAMSTAAPTQAR